MPISPPTDNLYKFLAIGGLALFIAATYFAHTQIRYFETEMDRAVQDDAQFGGEITALEKRQKRLEEKLKTLAEKAGELDGEMRTLQKGEVLKRVERLDEEIKDLKAAREAVHDVLLETRKRHEATLGRNEVLKRLLERLQIDVQELILIRRIGLAVSVLGFGLWYLMLQRWQDAAVRKSGQARPTFEG